MLIWLVVGEFVGSVFICYLVLLFSGLGYYFFKVVVRVRILLGLLEKSWLEVCKFLLDKSNG